MLTILFGVALYISYVFTKFIFANFESISDFQKYKHKNLTAQQGSFVKISTPQIIDDNDELKISSRVLPTTLTSTELIKKWNQLNR